MPAGSVVGMASTREFQRDAVERVGEEQLRDVVVELGRKSARLTELLADGRGRADRDLLLQILRLSFGTRRRAERILDEMGATPLAGAIESLMNHDEDLVRRFNRFDEALNVSPAASVSGGGGFDLASELLHFADPDRYWLWTRWIWDPHVGTGALALLTVDGADLGSGTTRGETYLNVGRASALFSETAAVAGLAPLGLGPFEVDVVLASAYGVYMHTALQMRLTREFSRVIPLVPEMIRRLLGVAHLGAETPCR